jgi:hypothetical protein
MPFIYRQTPSAPPAETTNEKSEKIKHTIYSSKKKTEVIEDNDKQGSEAASGRIIYKTTNTKNPDDERDVGTIAEENNKYILVSNNDEEIINVLARMDENVVGEAEEVIENPRIKIEMVATIEDTVIKTEEVGTADDAEIKVEEEATKVTKIEISEKISLFYQYNDLHPNAGILENIKYSSGTGKFIVGLVETLFSYALPHITSKVASFSSAYLGISHIISSPAAMLTNHYIYNKLFESDSYNYHMMVNELILARENYSLQKSVFEFDQRLAQNQINFPKTPFKFDPKSAIDNINFPEKPFVAPPKMTQQQFDSMPIEERNAFKVTEAPIGEFKGDATRIDTDVTYDREYEEYYRHESAYQKYLHDQQYQREYNNLVETQRTAQQIHHNNKYQSEYGDKLKEQRTIQQTAHDQQYQLEAARIKAQTKFYKIAVFVIKAAYELYESYNFAQTLPHIQKSSDFMEALHADLTNFVDSFTYTPDSTVNIVGVTTTNHALNDAGEL